MNWNRFFHKFLKRYLNIFISCLGPNCVRSEGNTSEKRESAYSSTHICLRARGYAHTHSHNCLTLLFLLLPLALFACLLCCWRGGNTRTRPRLHTHTHTRTRQHQEQRETHWQHASRAGSQESPPQSATSGNHTGCGFLSIFVCLGRPEYVRTRGFSSEKVFLQVATSQERYIPPW